MCKPCPGKRKAKLIFGKVKRLEIAEEMRILVDSHLSIWTKDNKMQEHLMVDGNNALFAIPELAREMSRDRGMARDGLLRMLEPLQAIENCLLTIVFDGKGSPQVVSKYRGNKEYTVIFSSSEQGADGVLERMLMASKYPERITVVTNDELIRNCAYESGASAMRVGQLLKRMDSRIEISKSMNPPSPPFFEKKNSFENKIPFPK